MSIRLNVMIDILYNVHRQFILAAPLCLFFRFTVSGGMKKAQHKKTQSTAQWLSINVLYLILPYTIGMDVHV